MICQCLFENITSLEVNWLIQVSPITTSFFLGDGSKEGSLLHRREGREAWELDAVDQLRQGML